MFEDYIKTELESIIENIYRDNNMLFPHDLTIRNLERAFNVNVRFMEDAPNRAIWDDEVAVIFLQSKMQLKEIRSVLFHEICHPFRHVGSQEVQPQLFRGLQEIQANLFQLYSSIPFFMLESITLPSTEDELVHLFEEVFVVTREVAVKRLEQIKARIWRNKMDIQLKEREKQRHKKNSIELSTESVRLLQQLSYQVNK
ncbi:ImmA/IrrE family metallo-endopeptidase [Bacillus infantis]|uniref:ImmA/IrrE family metallo-endopeptidase n=1 Tax=Bacillus infantis TaxID=324767 RepID=A0A5D4RH26_9BACI|nr:ImmA/IrrE family metallo-endopeptidase [Bacillus infantis]TYS50119.1 ImmA/IrrE family metallo-endopeptidase [Bacillus infantis]